MYFNYLKKKDFVIFVSLKNFNNRRVRLEC